LADIEPKELGFGLTAIIAVRTSECGAGVGDQLAAIPEVQEVHEVAGDDCFYIKIRAADTESLGVLLRERIKAVPNVVNTRTTVVLKTFKEGNLLPIELGSGSSADVKRKVRGR
jgi:Lrp/AsnC family leucine-responsive transcriptional regulator